MNTFINFLHAAMILSYFIEYGIVGDGFQISTNQVQESTVFSPLNG